MWNREAGRVHNRISEQENIQIDGARPLMVRSTTAHLELKFEQRAQQLFRRVGGFERDGTIQKPRLCCEFNGFSFIKRRDSLHLAEFTEVCDGVAQIGFTVANIRAEREIGEVECATHY